MMELLEFKLTTEALVHEMEKVLALCDSHRAKHFLCAIFCNYYSRDYEQHVELSQMDSIDTEFKQLFINIVLHRHMGFRGDSELCQLASRCKKFLDS
ncbi:hypothetical protein VCR6J2_420031 [Vibrio coralliirubri]|nr:hypothetical protein BCU38_16505 [Vibrio splendidus]CDT41746.1 hypothetical protein VCR6J2_420031 [Vibrio coralliirubri]CDT93290.1 hypothetical protein VCR8J2_480018 [Vibrio coralliirubri]